MAISSILQRGALLHRLPRPLWQAALLLLTATSSCGQAATNDSPTSPQPFTVHEVTQFSSPWAMDFLPGSGVPLTKMALVSEREGLLWLVDTATGRREAVIGVPEVNVAGQGGLGDVVVHPGFAGNQRVYLSFVEKGDGGSGAVLGYGRLILGSGPPRIDGFKIIWRQAPKVSGNGHFSHRIAFGPDGLLYLTSGDRQ